eukprot:12888804-Prorocentrum_lima.AAC.1
MSVPNPSVQRGHCAVTSLTPVCLLAHATLHCIDNSKTKPFGNNGIEHVASKLRNRTAACTSSCRSKLSSPPAA